MTNATLARPLEAPAVKPGEYKSIVATPLSPQIGAELSEIDLTKPLTDLQVAEVKRAFLEFQVIFFRDQKISFEDQIRLASYFGPLGHHVGGATISKVTDNPLVRKFHYDETSKKISGENFHSDQSCGAVPPLGSMLYNHTVPPKGGGDTMFSSMYAAYDALSPNMKQYLKGLTATHDGTRVFGPNTPTSIHPVITQHPETGKKVIYVNTDFTSHINEVSRSESKAILEYLYAHCNLPEWTVRFRWSAHSICFWDNRCTQHKAIWDYWPNVRSGFRVQIEGTAAPIAG